MPERKAVCFILLNHTNSLSYWEFILEETHHTIKIPSAVLNPLFSLGLLTTMVVDLMQHIKIFITVYLWDTVAVLLNSSNGAFRAGIL